MYFFQFLSRARKIVTFLYNNARLIFVTYRCKIIKKLLFIYSKLCETVQNKFPLLIFQVFELNIENWSRSRQEPSNPSEPWDPCRGRRGSLGAVRGRLELTAPSLLLSNRDCIF